MTPTPSFEDEFAGKTYREALEIILFDPKDADYTTKQINKLDELHSAAIEAARLETAKAFGGCTYVIGVDTAVGGRDEMVYSVIDTTNLPRQDLRYEKRD
jgi:hypothetical protein